MKNQGIIARLTGPKAEKGPERIFQIAPSQHRETNPSSRVTQSHGHKVLVRSGSPAALEILCLRSKFSRKFWRPHDGDRACGDATLPRQLVGTQLRENEPVATFAKTVDIDVAKGKNKSLCLYVYEYRNEDEEKRMKRNV